MDEERQEKSEKRCFCWDLKVLEGGDSTITNPTTE